MGTLKFIALNKNKFLLNFQFIIYLVNFSICTVLFLQSSHLIELPDIVFMTGDNNPGTSHEGSSNENGSSNNGNPNPNPQENNPVGHTSGQDQEDENRLAENRYRDADHRKRMIDCHHRPEDRKEFIAGENPVPIECGFDSGSGPHLAISRPYDQAILCQNCYGIICIDCNDPNQPDPKL